MAVRARFYRALPNPYMAGWEICMWVNCVPSWRCSFSAAASTSSRSRRMDFKYLGSSQDREKQLREDFAPSLAGWLDYTLEQRAPSESELTHNRVREPGWSTDPHKPRWVVSRVSTLDTQGQFNTGAGQWSGGRLPTLIDRFRIFCDEGKLEKALDVLLRVDKQGTLPLSTMYGCILKVCAKRKALPEAKQVHVQLVKHGLDTTRFLGEYMVSTLVHCGDLEGALQVFEKLSCRTAFSWTAVIFGYTMAGKSRKALQMYRCMQDERLVPNKYTFTSLLRACGSLSDLELAKQIHAEAVKYRCESNLSVVRGLIDMYAKCESIVDAYNVFNVLAKRDVVSWNLMVAGYVQQGQAESALELYGQMVEESLSPNDRTFVSLIQACGILAEKEYDAGSSTKLESLKKGKEIHDDAHRRGYDVDVFVGSTLVSMYGKCGSIVDAQNVFDGLYKKTVVSWTAMLSAYAQQGHAEKVLELYRQMLEACISPNNRTFVSAIQACGMLAEDERGSFLDGVCVKQKTLMKGKALHVSAWRKGYESDAFVSSTLISMYGKCGCIIDAQNVFEELPKRNVVVYNAMLAAYAHRGQAEKAFDLYEQMWKTGLIPNFRTFFIMLQACGMLAENESLPVYSQVTKTRYLDVGKALHAAAWRKGFESHVFVGSSLITMYGKCGSIVDAKEVFNQLPHLGVVSWNSMLAAQVRLGQGGHALQLFEEMQERGISPNERTFVTVLQACGMLAEQDKDDCVSGQSSKLDALSKGKVVHANTWTKNCNSDVFVGNSLISMYGKCGSTLDAQNVFDGLCQRDVVSWNAMLMAYAKQAQAENAVQLYEQMLEHEVSPDLRTFVSVLQACCMLAKKDEGVFLDGVPIKVKALGTGKAIHAITERRDDKLDIFLGSILVAMYGKCGSIVDAELVFDGLHEPNVVSWNAMLAAYVQVGQAEKALILYKEMGEEGLCPTERTFVIALQACASVAQWGVDFGVDGLVVTNKIPEKGKPIHADSQIAVNDSNGFVGSTLISMYGKCASILDAQDVFNGLCQQSLVHRTSMVIGYVELGHVDKALQLYRHMQNAGMSPDVRTSQRVLLSCGALAEKEDKIVRGGCLSQGKLLEMIRTIHVDAWQKGCNSDPYIVSTLINSYQKCGSLSDALKVFDGLSSRNLVTWTTMLAAHAQQGQGEQALHLYREMQVDGVQPDDVTHVCILQVCSKTGSLDICRQVHHAVASSNVNFSPLLANTLIHAYGRCASMMDAQIVFDALPQPDVMAWTALIAGYAREGNVAASLHFFEEMQLADTKPDGVTFLSLLAACCHAGLVDKGKEYFESMSRDYDITPDVEHYSSMVDLLGRAGHFNKVEHLLSTMPMQPNLSIWSSLLGACRKHGETVLGKQAFDCAVRLQPKHSSAYVLMFNIYSDAGLWDLANEVMEMRQKEGAWKEPGQSWIEHKEAVHTFVVGDSWDPQLELTYGILREMSLQHLQQGCFDSDLNQKTIEYFCSR